MLKDNGHLIKEEGECTIVFPGVARSMFVVLVEPVQDLLQSLFSANLPYRPYILDPVQVLIINT